MLTQGVSIPRRGAAVRTYRPTGSLARVRKTTSIPRIELPPGTSNPAVTGDPAGRPTHPLGD